jgi:hypothetical protein
MTQTASKTQILMAQVAGVLMVVFVLAGVAWYGISAHVFERIWQNMLDRPSGPMKFRFILQPVMAGIAALYDGVHDARTGRSYHLWTILTNPAKRGGRLREGLISTARVLLLCMAMDVIYQLTVFEIFHPGEAVILALLLVAIPYLLLRGLIARIAVWWRGDGSAN